MKEIPQWALDRANRAAVKRIAAAIIGCMADTDFSLEQIARRVNKPESVVRECLYAMIDGKKATLDQFSDLLLAMSAEPVWGARPVSFSLKEPEQEVSENQVAA